MNKEELLWRRANMLDIIIIGAARDSSATTIRLVDDCIRSNWYTTSPWIGARVNCLISLRRALVRPGEVQYQYNPLFMIHDVNAIDYQEAKFQVYKSLYLEKNKLPVCTKAPTDQEQEHQNEQKTVTKRRKKAVVKKIKSYPVYEQKQVIETPVVSEQVSVTGYNFRPRKQVKYFD